MILISILRTKLRRFTLLKEGGGGGGGGGGNEDLCLHNIEGK
jgi:hypothetical protein